MTLCENCRGQMVINRVFIDFGEGDEEVEFEACTDCKVVCVDIDGWSVGGNGR